MSRLRQTVKYPPRCAVADQGATGPHVQAQSPPWNGPDVRVDEAEQRFDTEALAKAGEKIAIQSET